MPWCIISVIARHREARVDTCAYSRGISSARVFTFGPKHWLSRSWRGHVFLHTARRYHRQCFYSPHKGQHNMPMSCPSAPGYQQETSFAEQEVLLSNWPKVIQWEPLCPPMRTPLFWERLYKQTRRASVRQSSHEVVGSWGFLVNWELSNAKVLFLSLLKAYKWQISQTVSVAQDISFLMTR